jgi:hypothetical protein
VIVTHTLGRNTVKKKKGVRELRSTKFWLDWLCTCETHLGESSLSFQEDLAQALYREWYKRNVDLYSYWPYTLAPSSPAVTVSMSK